MRSISAFTFVHNAIDSGYPIFEAVQAVAARVDEVVIVDMQSTDDTRGLLEKLKQKYTELDKNHRQRPPVKILDGFWGDEAGETLRQAHNLYIECSGDIIIHFEADEVYSESLISRIWQMVYKGDFEDLAVYRLQISQNFQRCRWYPEPVHRVFPRLSHTRKEGHTTDRHRLATVIEPENGFLWDCTNCFRDNFLNRINKQAELRKEQPNYLSVPIHCTHVVHSGAERLKRRLQEPHWEWTNTPFDIPDVLKPLVGMTKYEANL